jgi:hypothetical protein
VPSLVACALIVCAAALVTRVRSHAVDAAAHRAFFQRVRVEACFRAVGDGERTETGRIYIGPGVTKQCFMG